jgi:hypothetical protein
MLQSSCFLKNTSPHYFFQPTLAVAQKQDIKTFVPTWECIGRNSDKRRNNSADKYRQHYRAHCVPYPARVPVVHHVL